MYEESQREPPCNRKISGAVSGLILTHLKTTSEWL